METHEPRRGDGRLVGMPCRRGVSAAPDTTPEVSHRRAEQPAGARGGSAVSNSAARVVSKRVAGNLTATEFGNAAIPTRSPRPASARGTRRSPVGSTAPAQKSERTLPHEGSCIRSTGSRRKALSKGERAQGVSAMDNDTDSWGQRTVRSSLSVCWPNWATTAIVLIHPRDCNATPARPR